MSDGLDQTQVVVAALGVASAVVVAVIGLVGVLLSRQVGGMHSDNRVDHAQVHATITSLVESQETIAADVRDVKADVRELKASDRMMEARLDRHLDEAQKENHQ